MSRSAVLLLALVAFNCVSVGVHEDAGAPPVPIGPARTVYFDARVAGHGESWAIEVVGARIGQVGPSDALRDACRPPCRGVDVGGRFVQAGFHDAHVHSYTAGLESQWLVLAGGDVPALQAAVTAWASQHPDDAWILGRGWDINQLPAPTAAQLDQAERLRPVALTDHSGHNVWANTAAMAAAGITRTTPDPIGGSIARDGQGNPVGLFRDAASSMLMSHAPPRTEAEQTAAILTGQRLTLRAGCTASQGGPVPLDVARLYQRLDADGRLAQRTFLWAPLALSTADFDAWVAWARALPADGKVMLGGFKGFVDGTLSAETAGLLAPYADAPSSSGALYQTTAALSARISRANQAGFPVMLHAIGDAAVRRALDGFEAAGTHPPAGLLNRVEHASLVAADDLPRFAALQVAASVQPVWLQGYRSSALWATRLGAQRLPQLHAFASLKRAGATLLFGSDLPSSDLYDPVLGVWAATSRRLAGGEVFQPAEALDFEAALEAYTIAPAAAAGQGATLGRLEPGFAADFIVLHHDPRNGGQALTEDPLEKVVVAGVEVPLE